MNQENQQNPYSPPAAGETDWDPNVAMASAAPEATPTSAPKVFGVLSIVFSSITLLTSLFSSCLGLFGGGMTSLSGTIPGSGADAGRVKEMMEFMGTIYTAMGAQGVVFLVMSAILLVVGIGQLRYRRWAAQGSVYWSILALLVLVGVVILSYAVIGPAYEKMFEVISKGGASGALPTELTSKLSGWIGGSTGIASVIFYAPYPILMLIFFSRPRIKAAMQQ
jgi:hypothetical protein